MGRAMKGADRLIFGPPYPPRRRPGSRGGAAIRHYFPADADYTIKIRLNSTADTGYFYVTKKNSRTMTEKMSVKKYDPVARKHVEFKEAKIK